MFTATYCDTLRQTAISCSAPQHTARHCITLQHNAAHCSTMQGATAQCKTLHRTATYSTYTATTLQLHCYTATHCNTLQHTATHVTMRDYATTFVIMFHFCPRVSFSEWLGTCSIVSPEIVDKILSLNRLKLSTAASHDCSQKKMPFVIYVLIWLYAWHDTFTCVCVYVCVWDMCDMTCAYVWRDES